MKEGVRGAGGNARSAVEKERTKMRERQRRSITTNIFHGLRKHGGYRLSPRADINEVLRHLAREAGWVVEPDGTTYRSPSAFSDNTSNACPLCGGGRKGTAPATPSGSYLAGGGECSTTASPRRAATVDSVVNNSLSAGGLPPLSSAGAMATNETLLAIYMCGAAASRSACVGVAGGSDAAATGYGKGQQLYLMHEGSVSNQNTPTGSP